MKIYEAIVSLIKQVAAMDMQSSQKSVRLQQMISAHAGAFVQANLTGLQKLPTQEEFSKLREQRRVEAEKRIAEERRIEMERRKLEEEIVRKKQHQKKTTQEGGDVTAGSNHFRHRRSRSSEGSFAEEKPARVSSARTPTSPADGWKPLEVRREIARENDPLLQQMEIIKGYIRQARQDSRPDEVRMLKENLADLEKEFKRNLNNY